MRWRVIACAVALTALGCAATASASAWSAYDLSDATGGTLAVGRPAPFRDPGTGQPLAFANTPSGHLIEIAGAGAGPLAPYDITTLSGGGESIVGDPTPAVDPATGHLLVLASGPSGHLIEFDRAPTGWSPYDLTASAGGTQTITGDPAPVVDPATGHLLVVADSPNGHLLQFDRSPTTGAWTAYDLTSLTGGTVTIRGDPTPIVDPQNHDLLVFAHAADGTLEEFDRNPAGSWRTWNITGYAGPGVAGDPVPLVNPQNGDLLVCALSTGGHLIGFDRSSATFVWGYDDLTSATAQAVAGTPDPAVDPQTGGLLAFAQSPSGHLVEFVASAGSWSADDLTATAGAPLIAAQPQVLHSPTSGDLLVYVTTPGEHVVELDRSQPAPPTQSTPVPVSVPPPRARGHVKVRISITWTWRGARTLIHRVVLSRLRARANVRVGCTGRGCPWRRALAAPRRRVTRLLRSLDGSVLHAGDRLQITIREPGLIAERVSLRIRDGRRPLASLL